MNKKRKIILATLGSSLLIAGGYTVLKSDNHIDKKEKPITIDLNKEIKKPILKYEIKHNKEKEPYIDLKWETYKPNQQVNLYKGGKLIYSGKDSSFIDRDVKDGKNPPQPEIAYIHKNESNTKANIQLSKLEDRGQKYNYKIEVIEEGKKYVSEEEIEVKSELSLFSDNTKIRLNEDSSFEVNLSDGELPSINLFYLDIENNRSRQRNISKTDTIVNEQIKIHSMTRGLDGNYYKYTIDFELPEGYSIYNPRIKIVNPQTFEFTTLPLTVTTKKYDDTNLNQDMQNKNMYTGTFEFVYNKSQSDTNNFNFNSETTVDEYGYVNIKSFIDRESYYPDLGKLVSTYNFSLILNNEESETIEYDTGYNDGRLSYSLKDKKTNMVLSSKVNYTDSDDISGLILDNTIKLNPLTSEYEVSITYKYRWQDYDFPKYPSTSLSKDYKYNFISPYEFDTVSPDIELSVVDYRKSTAVKVNCYDSNSGLSHLIIKPLNKKVDIVDMTYTYEETINLDPGIYVFEVYDMAGNMSQQQIEVFERPQSINPPGGTLPDITINKTPNEDWTNGPVDITVTEKPKI